MKKILPLLLCCFFPNWASVAELSAASRFTGAELLFPSADSLGAEVFDVGEKTVSLPFETSPKMDRAAFDAPAALDLTPYQTFYLDWECDAPDAVDGIVLYFRSGKGWYSMSGSKARIGENRFRSTFSAHKRRTENSPTAWNSVDAVRIAFYAGKRLDAEIRLCSLVGNIPDIGILTSEAGTYDRQFAALLDGAGLSAAILRESEATPGMLARYPILVLSGQNPISAEGKTLELLQKYVENGGFLIAAYSQPKPILDLIGVRQTGWIRCSDAGLQLSGMKIVKPEGGAAKNVPETPDFLPQSSWNFVVAEPVKDGGGEVSAWWADAEGALTPYPAMIRGPHCLYITHVFQSTSGFEEKCRFLSVFLDGCDAGFARARLLAKWREALLLGRNPCAAPDLNDFQYAEKQGAGLLAKLRETGWTPAEVQSLLAGPSVDTFRMRELLGVLQAHIDVQRREICASVRPLPGERRFIWEHSGLGIDPGNWDATMKLLRDTGFTGIIANQVWAGSADYASDVLPRSSNFERYGDQIQQALDAGRKFGVELHVWKVNYNCGHRSPAEFIAKMRTEGRLQKSFTGQEEPWLCPSDPRNQVLEIESLLEIARKYDVAGIHMDYIRYPDANHCFCEGCRERFGAFFQAETGEELEADGREWPQCVRSPEITPVWDRWRCGNITTVVRKVYHGVKAIRPSIEVSAAVASRYPAAITGRAQDWIAWGHEGILDFACPMDYTENHSVFNTYVDNQMTLMAGKIPVYPGIGVYSSGSRMSADQGAVQIQISRKWNTGGFVFFSLNRVTATELMPFFE